MDEFVGLIRDSNVHIIIQPQNLLYIFYNA